MGGYVHVYTGNGKGKTTAAVGLALRAAGAGLNVFFGQFVKSEKYSEISALDRFPELVTCRRYGSGCWLTREADETDVRMAREGLEDIRGILSARQHQLVILDEVCIAEHFGLLSVEDLLALIEIKPLEVELIFTGRYAHPQLIERADLCTEMREVKHYYQQGVLARKGIDH